MSDKQSLRIGIIAMVFILLSFGVIRYAMSNLNDIQQRKNQVKTILNFRGFVMPSPNTLPLSLAQKRRMNSSNTPTILIAEEIDSGRAIQIIQAIKLTDANTETKEMHIRLKANGKDMSSVLAIYYTIKQCHKPVNIVADAALSGAVLILASGTPGKRTITQDAVINIEQPVFKDEPNKFKKFLLENLYLRLSFINFRSSWLNLLAQNTQQSIKSISKLNHQERTLSVEEVIKFGFADQIIENNDDNKDSENE